MKKFILRDTTSIRNDDDLITFNDDVKKDDVIKLITELGINNPEYTREDVYKELGKLGKLAIKWVGRFDDETYNQITKGVKTCIFY